MKFLIIQTAFIGDVILSLPLASVLKNEFPDSEIEFLCIPKTAPILKGNPYISEVILYDKHSKERHIEGFFGIVQELRLKKYDVVFAVQRFLRTTLISRLSGAGRTVSYDKSAMSFLYSDRVVYEKKHEILRVLDLLKPLGITNNRIVKPELFPSLEDVETVDNIVKGLNVKSKTELITLAPGSVWFTKRYPKIKFVNLLNICDKEKFKVALIGGEDDRKLCESIIKSTTNNEVYNFAGKLSFLQSAELIRRSCLLITNDSAPLHLADAVGTKVIALFGSTVSDFGFYPFGKKDVLLEVNGLKCRPCTNHGKQYCQIKTFDCMNGIKEELIYEKIKESLLDLS
ncbi:MAG: glycosyltransferase family 9 protein [Ignavibacteria bacterium]|nr:glycosyltransferase family 9 protein [Ignavibacteria bacterium]